MIHRTIAVRRHTRFPVRWPVLYGCADFVSEGTVLDVTPYGWRIAGAMPVQPGLALTIQVWAEGRREPMRLEQARVLWVKGCEFALDTPRLAAEDQRWIDGFLDRKLSLGLMRPASVRTASSAEQADSSISVVSIQKVEAEAAVRSYGAAEAAPTTGISQEDACRLFTAMRARARRRGLTGRDSIFDS